MALRSIDVGDNSMEAPQLVNNSASNCKLDDPAAQEIQEATMAALQSTQRLLQMMQQLPSQNRNSVAHEAFSNFRKILSLLGSRGHALVRRGPLKPPPSPSPISLLHSEKILAAPIHQLFSSHLESSLKIPLNFQLQTSSALLINPNVDQQHLFPLPLQHPLHAHQPDLTLHDHPCLKLESSRSCSTSCTSAKYSSLSMSGSVAYNKIPLLKPLFLAQEQLKAPYKSKFPEKCGVSGVKCGSAGKCPCSKRRKVRVKRTVHVPAISIKLADIPPDEFSWRKYGQKPIKGSPYPRLSSEHSVQYGFTVVVAWHFFVWHGNLPALTGVDSGIGHASIKDNYICRRS